MINELRGRGMLREKERGRMLGERERERKMREKKIARKREKENVIAMYFSVRAIQYSALNLYAPPYLILILFNLYRKRARGRMR